MERTTTSFLNQREIDHISLILNHLFLRSKGAITEALLERNQLKEKLVVTIIGNVYLY